MAGVGWDWVGLVTAHELGVPWERLVLVAAPEDRRLRVSALSVAVDAFDVVVVCSTHPVGAGDARRLAARVRERRAMLIVVDGLEPERTERSQRGPRARSASWWPEVPDVELRVARGSWEGLGCGHGRLQARWVEVEATGRGRLTRPRRIELWLPATTGGVELAEPAGVEGINLHDGPAASAGLHPEAVAS